MSDSVAAAPRRRAGEALAWTAVAGVVVVHGLLTWRWMRDNGFFARPPSHDASWYRLDAQLMLDALRQDGIWAWLRAAFDYDGSHPPLVMALSAAVAGIAGADRLEPATAWPTTFLFGALLVCGVYRLARNFFSPARAAFAAAVASCCPVHLCFWRPFEVQMPMAALVLWSLDALLRSDGLRRRGAAAASGALLGAAALAKMLAPLYVAGAFAAVAVAGLRRPATRRATLRGAAAWLVAAGAVAALWYARHWRGVLGYTQFVVGEEGQERFSRAASAFSAERWLYYPVAIVDHGFGLPLALCVAAALVAGLVRAVRARGRGADSDEGPPRAAALAASVVVAWPVITLGTTVTFANYVQSFVPLGVLALVGALGLARRAGVRAALFGAVAVVAVWQGARAFRAPAEDVDGPRYGGVAVFGQVDTQIAGAVRKAGGLDAPDAEPWPTREFAEAMLRAVPHRKPRLAYVMNWENPFVSSANLRFEALGLGRDLSLSSLSQIGTTDGPDVLATLRRADFAVVTLQRLRRGARRLGPEKLIAELAEAGLDAEIVARRRPTTKSDVSLVAMRWPHPAEIEPVAAAALERPGVRRVAAEFANGWRLLALRHGVVGTDALVCTAYFEPRPAGAAAFECVVEPSGGGTDARPSVRVATLATGDATDGVAAVAVTASDFPATAEAGTAYRLFLREAGGGGGRRVPVVASGLPRDGEDALRLDLPPMRAVATAASRPASRRLPR